MVEYIQYTPKCANNWSRAYVETQKERPWVFQRLVDSSFDAVEAAAPFPKFPQEIKKKRMIIQVPVIYKIR